MGALCLFVCLFACGGGGGGGCLLALTFVCLPVSGGIEKTIMTRFNKKENLYLFTLRVCLFVCVYK